jgi:hypothetical protein
VNRTREIMIRTGLKQRMAHPPDSQRFEHSEFTEVGHGTGQRVIGKIAAVRQFRLSKLLWQSGMRTERLSHISQRCWESRKGIGRQRLSSNRPDGTHKFFQ